MSAGIPISVCGWEARRSWNLGSPAFAIALSFRGNPNTWELCHPSICSERDLFLNQPVE